MSAQPQPFPLDGAVALVWAAVLDGRYENVHEAARELWPDIERMLDRPDQRHLAARGLADLCAEKAHPLKSNTPPVRYGAPSTPKGWEQYATLYFPYQDEQHRQKPLIDFTIGDWQAFELRMKTASTSFARRAKMAKTVIETLVESGAETLRDLDPVKLAGIEALASDTLRAYDGT